MFFKQQTVSITTDASGNGTGFTEVVNGRVLAIIYAPDGTTPYSNNFQAVFTTDVSLQAVLTKSQATATNPYSIYPKVQNGAVVDGSSIAATFDFIPLAGSERVKIVISGGGNTKTGQFTVILG